MHLHRTGRRNKGDSIWIGLILAGAIVIVTIVVVIRIGWLALAPFGFEAVIVSNLLLLTLRYSASVRAQDRADG